MTATDTSELVERAAALRPIFERNAAKGEEDRRIADESIDALVEAGLFKITVPRRFGGSEVDIRTKLEVSAAVAEGDGATGWVLAPINVCHWLVGLYRDQAQQDIFGADPDARVCGVLAPSVETRREDGGLVVSGRWPWASGSLDATWGLVGVLDRDAAGAITEHALALIPMTDLAVEVVRGRDEGDGLEHARGRRGPRPRPPPALRAEGDRERVPDRACRRAAVPARACEPTPATPPRPSAPRSIASSPPTERRASPTRARCSASGATRTPPAATAVVSPTVSLEVYGKALLGVDNDVTDLV